MTQRESPLSPADNRRLQEMDNKVLLWFLACTNLHILSTFILSWIPAC